MRIRDSARGVVFNDDGEILLLRCEDKEPVDPRNPDLLRYWVTPGGGTKSGETPEQSLVRELYEETGMVDVVVGACVWLRELELVLPERGPVLSRERYFLCQSREKRTSREHMTVSERTVIKEMGWWALDRLADSSETFRPPGLVPLVRRLCSDGPPSEPIRIEG
ncbi:NUDIX hydrolase [Streptomyces silvisoli]|uniref:NUDIX domain-containing protein n=1 Tax=Streptomyces silvisoli TaxID=3034235 RepID=A0ABT5ZL24_9ACTN|nr:NUDIX domain-containing protein [Streptomyces silvisoli]MDF3290304.1 NUDIX domain-containing protein [Streptomyces silvisoli]